MIANSDVPAARIGISPSSASCAARSQRAGVDSLVRHQCASIAATGTSTRCILQCLGVVIDTPLPPRCRRVRRRSRGSARPRPTRRRHRAASPGDPPRDLAGADRARAVARLPDGALTWRSASTREIVPELAARRARGLDTASALARVRRADAGASAVAVGECGLDGGTGDHALQEAILVPHRRSAPRALAAAAARHPRPARARRRAADPARGARLRRRRHPPQLLRRRRAGARVYRGRSASRSRSQARSPTRTRASRSPPRGAVPAALLLAETGRSRSGADRSRIAASRAQRAGVPAPRSSPASRPARGYRRPPPPTSRPRTAPPQRAKDLGDVVT